MPNNSDNKSGFYKFLSNFLIFIGVFFGITSLFGIIEALFFIDLGPKKLWDFLIVLLLLGGIPTFFGFKLKKKYKELENINRLRTYEQIVLRILTENDNYINAATLSLKSGLPTIEARQILDTLANQGVISPEIDDDGNIYYTCPQLIKRKTN
jgi:predicted transcriptional regulator